jgi:protein-tyrosine phosphatase
MWPLGAPELRVLVVCSANICRSPVAAALLKAHLKDAGMARRVATSSAGTSVGSPGARADPRMQELARLRAVRLSRHRAREVSDAVMAASDVIYAMEELHLEALQQRWPERAADCGLLDAEGGPIADPYFGSKAAVREAFETIDRACARRAADLARQMGPAA